MTPPRKATKAVASRRGLEKSGQKAAWLSHIPTATAGFTKWTGKTKTGHFTC